MIKVILMIFGGLDRMKDIDDYLDIYAEWYDGEKKLIRELEREGKIPTCSGFGEHKEVKMTYNKESGIWECPRCEQKVHTWMRHKPR